MQGNIDNVELDKLLQEAYGICNNLNIDYSDCNNIKDDINKLYFCLGSIRDNTNKKKNSKQNFSTLYEEQIKILKNKVEKFRSTVTYTEAANGNMLRAQVVRVKNNRVCRQCSKQLIKGCITVSCIEGEKKEKRAWYCPTCADMKMRKILEEHYENAEMNATYNVNYDDGHSSNMY